MISYFVYLFVTFIFIVVVIDCLMSWIPGINYNRQPALFIRSFSNFFLTPMRKIIPPIGGWDISPIITLILIKVIGDVLIRLFASFGL